MYRRDALSLCSGGERSYSQGERTLPSIKERATREVSLFGCTIPKGNWGEKGESFKMTEEKFPRGKERLHRKGKKKGKKNTESRKEYGEARTLGICRWKKKSSFKGEGEAGAADKKSSTQSAWGKHRSERGVNARARNRKKSPN